MIKENDVHPKTDIKTIETRSSCHVLTLTDMTQDGWRYQVVYGRKEAALKFLKQLFET